MNFCSHSYKLEINEGKREIWKIKCLFKKIVIQIYTYMSFLSDMGTGRQCLSNGHFTLDHTSSRRGLQTKDESIDTYNKELAEYNYKDHFFIVKYNKKLLVITIFVKMR